jgi:hypothetical protein
MQDSLHILMVDRWAGVCEMTVQGATKFARLVAQTLHKPVSW